MTIKSKCCSAAVKRVDGEDVCTECWQPCRVTDNEPMKRSDEEYERARMRGWED